MKHKFEELVTAIFVSTVIGLALSYLTILNDWFVDLNFLEAVAVYHFLIHIGNFLKAPKE
jgi:hypothetical protein